MNALTDIDKIDDIAEMVTTMASLKISIKELTTLDEMNAKVKETLQSLQKNSSWTAKEVRTVQYLFKIWTTSKPNLQTTVSVQWQKYLDVTFDKWLRQIIS